MRLLFRCGIYLTLPYDYQFKYRAGVKHGNADALSRLPLKSGNGENIDHDNTPLDNIPINTEECDEMYPYGFLGGG